MTKKVLVALNHKPKNIEEYNQTKLFWGKLGSSLKNSLALKHRIQPISGRSKVQVEFCSFDDLLNNKLRISEYDTVVLNGHGHYRSAPQEPRSDHHIQTNNEVDKTSLYVKQLLQEGAKKIIVDSCFAGAMMNDLEKEVDAIKENQIIITTTGSKYSSFINDYNILNVTHYLIQHGDNGLLEYAAQHFPDTLFIRHGDLYKKLVAVKAETGKRVVKNLLSGEQKILNVSPYSQSFKNYALTQASQKGKVKDAQFWLNQRARINNNDTTTFKTTPLIVASLSGDEVIARLLLKHGAEVNKTDNSNASPLYAATQNRHEAIVKLLLEHGAHVNQAKKDGISPLYKASVNGHEAIVKLLLKHGAHVNQASKKGFSPLYKASVNGHEAIVKLLLEHGANANKSIKGSSVLKTAIYEGHTEIVKVLLEHGADANESIKGSSALETAIYKGHTEIVKVLLEHGANANKSEKGSSALETAIYLDHKDIANLLIEYGAKPSATPSIKEKPQEVAAIATQEAQHRRQ